MLALQVVLRNYTADPQGYDDALRAAGTDWVLLSLCEFFESGDERQKKLNDLSYALERLRGQGYRVALWTNSLGWGGNRNEAFYGRFKGRTVLTEPDGGVGTAVCTLDPAFTEYMVKNTQDFIRASADCILWDDDLVQSVRPGFLCTCKRHLARFAEITGRVYTREDVKRLFTGAPSGERAAYLDLMG